MSIPLPDDDVHEVMGVIASLLASLLPMVPLSMLRRAVERLVAAESTWEFFAQLEAKARDSRSS